MGDEGQNQLLMSIQASLMTLLSEVGAVKQSIEHLVTNHDRLRSDMEKLEARIKIVEDEQLVNASAWSGPKTLLGVLAIVVTAAAGAYALIGSA